MPEPVNLSVHRNTRDRRARSDRRKQLLEDAKELSRNEIAGYVILVWSADWTSHAHWDMGESLPAGLLPVFSEEILRRHLGIRDATSVVHDALCGDDEGS